MGRPSEESLESVTLRVREGASVVIESASRSGLLVLAAARVAGATEKRRPI